MARLSDEKRLVSLITDFGLKDPFVGIMKGVMLSINSHLTFVDISHEIRPHHILEAAVTLKLSYRYFPKGTIHLVVVDPGVGGDRLPLAAFSSGYFFVGPDNGVLAPVLDENDEGKMIIRLLEERYFREEVSSTFHGRDVFGPAAAWISRGIALTELGQAIMDYRKMAIPGARLNKERHLEGEVIFCDQFGNMITSITKSDLDEYTKMMGKTSDSSILKVRIGPYVVSGLKKSYDQGSQQELSALFNSFNYLEIFLFQESAQRFTRLQPSEKVILSF